MPRGKFGTNAPGKGDTPPRSRRRRHLRRGASSKLITFQRDERSEDYSPFSLQDEEAKAPSSDEDDKTLAEAVATAKKSKKEVVAAKDEFEPEPEELDATTTFQLQMDSAQRDKFVRLLRELLVLFEALSESALKEEEEASSKSVTKIESNSKRPTNKMLSKEGTGDLDDGKAPSDKSVASTKTPTKSNSNSNSNRGTDEVHYSKRVTKPNPSTKFKSKRATNKIPYKEDDHISENEEGSSSERVFETKPSSKSESKIAANDLVGYEEEKMNDAKTKPESVVTKTKIKPPTKPESISKRVTRKLQSKSSGKGPTKEFDDIEEESTSKKVDKKKPSNKFKSKRTSNRFLDDDGEDEESSNKIISKTKIKPPTKSRSKSKRTTNKLLDDAGGEEASSNSLSKTKTSIKSNFKSTSKSATGKRGMQSRSDGGRLSKRGKKELSDDDDEDGDEDESADRTLNKNQRSSEKARNKKLNANENENDETHFATIENGIAFYLSPNKNAEKRKSSGVDADMNCFWSSGDDDATPNLKKEKSLAPDSDSGPPAKRKKFLTKTLVNKGDGSLATDIAANGRRKSLRVTRIKNYKYDDSDETIESG